MAKNAQSRQLSPPAKGTEAAPQRIVEAAIEVFCRKGYDAASVREIVEAAGVTKPVLYYYFGSKEGLFTHILESMFDPFLSGLNMACRWEKGPFRDRLKAIADLHIQAAKDYPGRVRFIHGIAYSALYDHLFDFRGNWMKAFNLITRLFEAGQKKRVVRRDISPQALAGNFIGMAHAAMRGIAYCPTLLEELPDSKDIVEIIMKGIGK